ncbi:FAD-binding domain-containing protein [Ascodesmis nigricans]|uniref:FAD-binding domain-containing protein n=1 Tax=Ascodesmis nigricans TaxID=341454 RepID=A0A4S2MMZ7_9PEZI|nr:FAD-binding domain-containing protein [Ascodesmis nigricans]
MTAFKLLLYSALLFTTAFAGYNPIPRIEPIEVELARSLSPEAEIILPNDTRWNTTTKRWTSWSRPIVYANIEVATVEDVQATVNYTYMYNVPLLVRNSGHGFASSLDDTIRMDRGGIQISLRKMDGIEIDQVANTMTVEGGVKNWQVAEALAAAKKRSAIAACDCIGYLGAGLGGGHGRLEGLYGLIADNLLEAKLVIADGSLVTASESENPDLFWALRGAGHNYGIIVSATFRIHNPVDSETWITADYLYPSSCLPDLIANINRFRSIQPDSLTLNLFFLPDSTNASITTPPLIQVSIQYGGPADTFAALVRPFSHDLKPYSTTTANVPWHQINAHTGTGKDSALCTPGARIVWFSELLTKFETSDMVTSYEFLQQIREEYPQLAGSAMLWESFPKKAVKSVRPENTAYPWRDMNVISVFHVTTSTPPTLTPTGPVTDDDHLIKLLGEEGRRIMKRSYPNNGLEKIYVNYAFGNEGARSMYWGTESWRRKKLQNEKWRWDEYGIFSRFNPVWP